MEGGTVALIQPVSRIKWQELNLRPIRQISGLVHDESAFSNVRLDGHTEKVAPYSPPNNSFRRRRGRASHHGELSSLEARGDARLAASAAGHRDERATPL